ncbi:hypothetical protein STW0522RAO56_48100 [Raoultella planticola]|nr:hypothetical protein STW0522RAO56_48100 [Raoultella planticola]
MRTMSAMIIKRLLPAPRLALRLAGLPLRLTELPLCFNGLLAR